MVPNEASLNNVTTLADLANTGSPTLSRITPTSAPVSGSFEDTGFITGNTLKDVLASPSGQKVLEAVEDAIFHRIMRDAKKHQDHLKEIYREARAHSR